ncbi:hypothetical protein WFZ85_14470 [Flavobacterium sp. j3]|uniref:Restriction endonuclease n=1 Tax=Flavobacterium aureirubrum TaxID=3133147 RepID=A0ABU9N8Q0_9FLAO
MIQKFKQTIPKQRNGVVSSTDIFIVDYKKHNGGNVEVVEILPQIEHVYLNNSRPIEIQYFAFDDNALTVASEEGQVEHCECVLFPTTCNDSDWMLLAETKYSNDISTAFNPKYGYPNKMINQIISTVNYLRMKEVFDEKKRVSAILSFPKLALDFSETFYAMSDKTAEEILLNHNILIRPTNEGVVISEKRIKI